MGVKTKIFKNTTYLTIGNQIGNLLQFLFFLYFARQFGKEIVGQYSFAFSFTYVCSVIADLGLSHYLIREVARDLSGDRQLFACGLSLRLLSLALVSLLVFAIIILFPGKFPQRITLVIFLLGLFHIFFSIADVFHAEFKGHDRMGIVALLNIFLRFVISCSGILLIILRFDFLIVVACFPIGSFLYLILTMYLSSHYFKNIALKLKVLNLKNLFVMLLPFTFTFIFAEALHHQDILMLKFLKNDQIVGIYSVAHKIVLIFIGILLFVYTALLPTLSRLYVDSHSKLIDISRQSLRYLLLIGLPLSIGLFAVSDKIIVFMFSNTFKESVAALNVLSWTIVLNFALITYSVLLTAIDRQTEKGICVGICFAVNFLLNLILIPNLSYNGAAIAKVMTETLHLFLFAYLVSRYLTSLSLHKMLLKPAISCSLMYIVIKFIYQWHLIIIILISITVYFISLFVLRWYTNEEIEFIKHFCSRKLLLGKRTFEA
ncbi:MAG: flippase [Candidatus Hodarchaeota archaeon]